MLEVPKQAINCDIITASAAVTMTPLASYFTMKMNIFFLKFSAPQVNSFAMVHVVHHILLYQNIATLAPV